MLAEVKHRLVANSNMNKKSPIYTRGGDNGETSLYGGKRVKKFDPRIKTIGAIDELNAALGVVASQASGELTKIVEKIQNQLFVFGATLANPNSLKNKRGRVVKISKTDVTSLEKQIDKLDSHMKPLRQFILPGGTTPASLFHLCRGICRRAERELAELTEQNEVDHVLNQYLNRLSDLLFVLARYSNQIEGKREKPWKQE